MRARLSASLRRPAFLAMGSASRVDRGQRRGRGVRRGTRKLFSGRCFCCSRARCVALAACVADPFPCASTAAISSRSLQPHRSLFQSPCPFRSAMSLALLAAVKMQLIMQHCDAQSLLSLARCSRAALAAASTPFAWRHQPPLVVRDAVPDLPARLAGSLLSPCPLALALSPIGPRFSSGPSVTDEELRVAAALPRVRSLDTRAAQSARPPSPSCCSGPRCPSGLAASHRPRAAGLCAHGAAAAAPVRSAHSSRRDARFLLAAADAARPALADLSVEALCVARGDVRAVTECVGLRRLALAGLAKADWLPILTAPALRRLESLTLRDAAHNNGRARGAAIFSTSLTRRCPSWRATARRDAPSVALRSSWTTLDPARIALRFRRLRTGGAAGRAARLDSRRAGAAAGAAAVSGADERSRASESWSGRLLRACTGWRCDRKSQHINRRIRGEFAC